MMKLTKNIRISLYILIPIVLWMASGLFKNEKVVEVEEKSELFSVQTILSNAIEYQPLIKLKATTKSEARVDVKAKLPKGCISPWSFRLTKSSSTKSLQEYLVEP